MSDVHASSASARSDGPVIGTLLVHGLNGNRRDMGELAEHLAQYGIVSENMLLPGHGTTVRDMMTLGWTEWERAVHEELQQLKQRCDVVFLIGHSLGAALCLHTAAHEEVAGVVAMCAPLHMAPWIKPAVQVMKRIIPAVPNIREDVRDRKARRTYARETYRWTAMAPVESLLHFLPRMRVELPQVTAPTLVMVSAHDHVVPPRDGRAIYRLLGSKEKYLVTFHHSYHVIMKDQEKDEVFAKTLAFIQRQAVTARSHRTSDQSA
jgi:carboxylesterase